MLAFEPYDLAVLLAALWAAFNCIYVYLVLGGEETYRIESSFFVVAALILPLAFRRPTDTDPVAPAQQHNTAAVAAIAIVLWLITFVPLLGFPFLSDDYVFASMYRSWRVLSASQFFRPAFAAVFALLASIGRSTVPFHIVGGTLHLVSACLVYSLARRILNSAVGATIAFIIVLLNPLQLEATLWASGLQELLWTFFILCALRCYIGTRELGVGRMIATLVLIAAALLSKETAVSYVLLMPIVDLALFRFDRGPHLRVAYAAFAALLGSYLLVRSSFSVFFDANYFVTPSRFLVKQFVSIPYRLFAQPWNASALHPPAIVPCALALLVLVLLVSAALQKRIHPCVLVGPAIVFASTLPLAGYFYVDADLSAARYLYFPTIGWSLLIADLSLSVIRDRVALPMFALALAAGLALALNANLTPWRLAADLVVAMQNGRPLNPPAGLEMRDGVPYRYQGVAIFINGYPEFRDQ